MSVARNEQILMFARFLNGIASAFIIMAIGLASLLCVFPPSGGPLKEVPGWVMLILVSLGMAGVVLHFIARRVLGRLKE